MQKKMSDKNASAPAFGHGNPEQGGDPGLTKRELFAAMAMQGIMAHGERASFGTLADEAVDMADALLAALRENGDE